MDEQRLGIDFVAVGFEGEEEVEVATAKGDNGGEEVLLGVAIDQGVYIGSVGAVFVEPDDNAIVAKPLFDFGFEDGGDGAEGWHGR